MSLYGDVRWWHDAMGLPVDTEDVSDFVFFKRRMRLIEEETHEVRSALVDADRTALLDGICDAVWVLLGTAVELGMDFDGAWAEVRRSNYSKIGGEIDANGKLQKPKHYSPPQLEQFASARGR